MTAPLRDAGGHPRAVAASGAGATGDRLGHGVQPPQSDAAADDNAAARAGVAVVRTVFGSDRAGPVERQRLGLLAHYAFAAGAGITYALLVSRIPPIGWGGGCLYGTLVWGAADELAVPALELSRGPRELDVRTHVYALIGHFVYAATLHAVAGRSQGPE